MSLIETQLKRAEINSRPELVLCRLQRAWGKMYICPFCGSGTGKNHTAALSYFTAKKDNVIRFKCLSCMAQKKEAFDTVDMLKRLDGITESQVFERYLNSTPVKVSPAAVPIRQHTAEKETDYTAFFKDANKHISETTYHRGLSIDTLNRYWVGFVPYWRSPKSRAAASSPRLIIPTSRSSYFARDTRPDSAISQTARAYTKQNVGAVHLFNAKGLDTASSPIFVCEGAIDALSFIDAGFCAVGLGGLDISTLLQAVKDKEIRQTFVITLDNDGAESKAAKNVTAAATNLHRELTGQGFNAMIVSDMYDKYKDANEYFCADRAGFTAKARAVSDRARGNMI